MESHTTTKRRRVHPAKPNSTARNEFARKYANHLVPSLMMINKKDCTYGRKGGLEKAVKRQVNMALALSANNFAWGCALKEKLQKSNKNGETSLDQERKPDIIEKIVEGEELNDDEKIVSEKLESLRNIIPGGKEIESMHALLGELGCYIVCLESQVNVLRSLVDQNL